MADAQRTPQFSGSDELRASDRDRAQVAQILEEHFAAGRLTFDEVEQRIDGAYRSKTYGELRALLRDLPAVQPSAQPQPEPGLTEQVRERVAKLPPGMREQILHYASIMTVLIVIWAITGAGFFWPIFPLIALGIHLIRSLNGHEHQGCLPIRIQRRSERS